MEKEYIVDANLQDKFAELSGDFNPLHTDELYARKTFFGKQVVHGLHQVFAMLDVVAAQIDFPFFIKKIDVNFESSLGVAEYGVIKSTVNEGQASVIFSLKDGTKTTCLDILFKKAVKQDYSKFEQKEPFCKIPLNPRDFNSGYVTEKLSYDVELLKSMFGDIYKKISPTNIAVLLATTRIVGMKYPGLNSIYNKLSLTFKKEKFYQFEYQSIKKHPILNFVQIKIDSDEIAGTIGAIIRPERKLQTSIEQLETYRLPDCSGQRALIVGGSRGIGLQCLRLLGINGARTLFTYYRSYDDAIEIGNEFKKNGYITKYIQLDINNLTESDLNEIKAFNPTHLYYFPTPKISVGTGNLSLEKFTDFANCYIFALDTLIKKTGIKEIFTPSSTAIEELPRDMLEYAFAKDAMELYAKWMNEKKKVRIYTPRFPRTETDQTQSILSVKAEKAEDILRKELLFFLTNKE